MTFNQDGNVIGRVGALAVIALALWGVHRVSCDEGFCVTMDKPAVDCCASGAKTAPAEAKPAPAPAATPATR